MTFQECVIECSRNKEFVEGFDRLMKCNLSKVGDRAPIEIAIDDATGALDDDMKLFVLFVYDTVWSRIPR